MYRDITNDLLAWKDSKYRKALLLYGARQTGKTYIIDQFAENNYTEYVKINCEKDAAVHNIFKDDLDPETIIPRIENHVGKRILPGKTLMFFDEIQACPRAIMSFKYFTEDAPEYHVTGAGSLLGVLIRRDLHTGRRVKDYSYPVGKVDELKLYPMNFREFLIGKGEEILMDSIVSAFREMFPLDVATHNKAISLYREYLAIGGMPEAVQRYIDTDSFIEAQSVIKGIYSDYIRDTAKYCKENEAIKNKACYEAITAQLLKENKNYKYSLVQEGKNKEYFGTSIEWLLSSGIALRSSLVSTPRAPLDAHKDEFLFRLYMSDVGLFRHKAGIRANNLLDPSYNDDLTGILAENYVACELACQEIPLLYWKGTKNAEIEFMLETENGIAPLEVKAGKHVKSKSLEIYRNNHRVPVAYRISQKNFGRTENIVSVPLYAVFCLAEQLANQRY